jgi:hypothetical protein
MNYWTVYVDESGKFWKSEPVVVAGVLMSNDVVTTRSVEWRSRLLKSVRGLPWPWHASLMNIPALVAVLIDYSSRNRIGLWVPPTPKVNEAVATVIQTLHKTAKQELADAQEALDHRKEPDHKRWRKLSVGLEKSEQTRLAIGVLEDLTRNAWEKVAAVLSEGSASADRAVPSLAVLLSSEHWRGAAKAEGDATGAARYRTLLACFLERLGDAISRLGGDHHIGLRVLSRGGQAPFHTQDLNRLVPTVVQLRQWPNVMLEPHHCVRYEGDLDVGYVFADFVAHRTREILDHRFDSLRTVNGKLCLAHITAPVRSGNPLKTHLAGAGEAQTFIRGFLNGNPPAPGRTLTPRYRQWVCDQVSNWIGWRVC